MTPSPRVVTGVGSRPTFAPGLARPGESEEHSGCDGRAGGHPGGMPPATSGPPPGSMTVPFLFQWEVLLAVVGVAVVLAVTFLALWATRPGPEDRAEWQAWLGARSRQPDPNSPEHVPAGPVRT